MTRAQYGSLSFDAPDGWRVHSIRMYVAPVQPGMPAPNIVVTSEKRLERATFGQHLVRRFTEQGQLPGFTLIERRTEIVAGLRAARSHFGWQKGPAGPSAETVVVYLDPGGDADVMTFTSTCLAPPPAAWMKAFDEVLASVTFGQVADAARTVTPLRSKPLPETEAGVMAPWIPMPGTRTKR
jgi:hypothetical protein